MGKQLVFIDDSGDPDFKAASSSNFVMAAAVFIDPDVAFTVMQEIDAFRRSLGWRDDYEFKFAKIRKDVILELLRIVAKYDFQIYATYIDKGAFRQITPIIDGEKLYNWTLKELLELVPLENAKITIDGRSSKENMQRTRAYLRREINAGKTKKIDIKFEDSVKTDLLQLADLVAGSINRALQSDKTDSKIYLRVIKDKVIEIKQITFR